VWSVSALSGILGRRFESDSSRPKVSQHALQSSRHLSDVLVALSSSGSHLMPLHHGVQA
jgi:hypothetical protein